MTGPFAAASASVVAKEHICRLALVERIGFAGFHDAADETVRPAGRVQIDIVSPGVSYFIGISEPYIEHLGMILFDSLHRIAEGEVVPALTGAHMLGHTCLYLVK